MSEQIAAFEIEPPRAPAGSAKVDAGELKARLTQLARFITRDEPAAVGYLWLYAQNGTFVALASDLAAIGQIDLRDVARGELPLLGLAPDNIKTLLRPITRKQKFVTLATAGGELTVADGPDELTRTRVRMPTAADRDILTDLGRHLAGAHAATDTAELPHGTNTYWPAKERLFGTLARRWFTPTGRIFVEVDAHFRGCIAAARPSPIGARRPLPAGQVFPALPTERTAA